MLNYLASTITLDDMLDGAIKFASSVSAVPEFVVEYALKNPVLESRDADIWYPHYLMLNEMQSWGWLSFTFEKGSEDGLYDAKFEVEFRPVCGALLELLSKRKTKLKTK